MRINMNTFRIKIKKTRKNNESDLHKSPKFDEIDTKGMVVWWFGICNHPASTLGYLFVA